METPPQHEERYAQGGGGHAGVAGDAEQLEAGGDPGELGARGAHVGENQDADRDGAKPHPVRVTDQPREALLGDDAMRAPRSWNTISATVESSSTHSSR